MISFRKIALTGAALLALGDTAFATASSNAPIHESRIADNSDAIAPITVTPRVMASNSVAAADAAQPVPQPTMAPMALNSFSNPPDKVATARVVDQKGIVIGSVQKVDVAAGGKPTAVEIALLGTNQIVSLDAKAVSYDATNNVLMTMQASQSQIATPRG
jgi:hypothetical protein